MKLDVRESDASTRQFVNAAIPFVERPACTMAEACSAVDFGKTKLYEPIDGGEIESIRIGRRRLVRVPSLPQFLGPTSKGTSKQ